MLLLLLLLIATRIYAVEPLRRELPYLTTTALRPYNPVFYSCQNDEAPEALFYKGFRGFVHHCKSA